MRILVLLCALAACGGKYASGAQQRGHVDRGETNGRSFEFVSNLPDGEDWQVRVRDSSMWASYSEGPDVKEYKPVNLDTRETKKFWDLVDALDMPDRKKGKQDDDEGYVLLKLREPGDEEGDDHILFSTFVSRATKDKDVIELGGYLQKLILKYHKKEADF